MADPVALVALALDAAIGWPDRLYARIGHPVGAFARFLNLAERLGNRPDWPEGVRRGLGVLTMFFLIALTGGAAWWLDRELHLLFGRWGWVASAVLAWPGLAQRSLYVHVRPVAAALMRGDLPAARTLVARVVGRDTDRLDQAGVSRAAIETLAESFCDGIVAPLFWLLLLGLPGLWMYKAINTADSLIGHKEPRWRAFGWAAARIDDGANWVPARIAGLLVCVAGAGGWTVMKRDARAHASPNAGWPEAAMAGALGIALAGPVAYDGVTQIKPWIGREGRAASPKDIVIALQIYARACLLLWLIAGGVAWLA
ncbi:MULTISPECIES: adenosylcobinamide-phosphate synthase CbiB [Sphingomonas]|jgi:adenosylcobinamide-phosphate synthase|uniref:Cobalamin biosynthesis protein CobD n=1 Tax=Sphingomonas zeae TaxID=1646122 RepID=A0A7Y6B6H4_9SPHN|nr:MULTISPECIES: adenosylcobinamide-phosphate synthase CbiB [Sphingomonas]MBB4047161.1 adenosylcobinamide-phosphate synthase [Sphingomonas zeae]MDK8186376.1 adenosylcobinamide-phosphate synthase CbiB [Sphingomonas zeae]MDK8216003.1 adenosylcobinamide-phosphate synthase CbiB [Sphingomonas sp. UMB7805-LC452B]NUU48309.1 cobalamin biosynthesis protein CobD [Sphingomonas zeae]